MKKHVNNELLSYNVVNFQPARQRKSEKRYLTKFKIDCSEFKRGARALEQARNSFDRIIILGKGLQVQTMCEKLRDEYKDDPRLEPATASHGHSDTQSTEKRHKSKGQSVHCIYICMAFEERGGIRWDECSRTIEQ